eukprot:GHVH01005512.1.p1 GENE.GHVH01005512.1~~GHVH01005512.1.p1  ORF type:complete len:186 (+),score=27.89 GHVH01005512.1:111-668(+)
MSVHWRDLWKSTDPLPSLQVIRNKLQEYETQLIRISVESDLKSIPTALDPSSWRLKATIDHGDFGVLLDRWESHCMSLIQSIGVAETDAAVTSERVFHGLFVALAKNEIDNGLIRMSAEDQLNAIWKRDIEKSIIDRLDMKCTEMYHCRDISRLRPFIQFVMDVTKAWEVDVLQWCQAGGIVPLE